jgi:hypothetical protein
MVMKQKTGSGSERTLLVVWSEWSGGKAYIASVTQRFRV